MRRSGVARATAAGIVALAVALPLAACGDDDNAVVTSRDGGGGGADAVALIDGAIEFPDAAAVDAGAFTVVDVPDTPCGARGGALTQVYAPDATTFRPLRMVAVGSRLAMQVDDGFVLMDGDGANPSAQVVAAPFVVSAIGSSTDALLGLGGDVQSLKLVRFDSAGASQPPVEVAAVSGSPAVSGGEGTALVAFLRGSELRARAFNADGTPLAPAFTFRQGVTETEAAAFDVVHAGGAEYGVAFAGQYAGTHRMAFTRVSTTARVGTSFTLLNGPGSLRLVQLAHAGTGFALLLERTPAGAPRETLVVILDAAGRISAPVLRLLGVRRAFGLASSGGEIGVLAWRARAGAEPDESDPDAVEFRPFEASGNPLGPWVCVDEAFPAPTVDVGAAILGDANGYRVLVRTPTHAVSLARFDRRGTGGL